MTVAAIYRTTIGKKVIMAVTGLIWVGYVILHMFGNLKIFQSAESINSWASFLRTFGSDILGYSGVLWIVRLVLIVSIVLHIFMAWQLTQLDWASRPVKYSGRRYLSANLSSLSMRWGGLFIFLFLTFHILNLTTGTLHSDFEELQPYHNLLVTMRNPLISGIYFLAMIVLGLHLYHGTWSLLQTLGFNSYPRSSWMHRTGQALSILIAAGFMTVPFAILLGFLK